jgi:hypothetical protein
MSKTRTIFACIECGKNPRMVRGDAIYPHRNDLHWMCFWLCECGAYVGSHEQTNEPLGSPAGPATRTARSQAHAAFDPIWRERRLMTREKAYRWLAEKMGMDRDLCHIAQMSEVQAKQVVSIVRRFLPS